MACKYGVDRRSCLEANKDLVRIGESPLHCFSCSLDPASKSVAVALTEKKRSVAARRWLRRMGFDQSPIDAGATLRTGFRCPVIQETISAPCLIEKCAWHVDYPWAANCLLAYMHQQGVDALSPEEIAYLHQYPVEHVRDLISEATRTLRSGAIDRHAVESGRDREFVFFVTDRVCCVCESAIDDLEPSLRIESVGAAYCSRECRDEKHPRLVELEIEKGMEIGRILDWSFRSYGSLPVAESALGVPRWLAYEACQRHLERPLDDYFPSIKVRRHRKTLLIRRTWQPPPWIAAMIARKSPVIRRVVLRHGPSDASIDALRRDCDHLISNL